MRHVCPERRPVRMRGDRAQTGRCAPASLPSGGSTFPVHRLGVTGRRGPFRNCARPAAVVFIDPMSPSVRRYWFWFYFIPAYAAEGLGVS